MSDLILDQGATWSRTWTYKDPDGDPINLTGCLARFQIRPGGMDGPAGVSLDSADLGGIVLGGTAGTIAVTVSAEASSAMRLGHVQQASGTETQADGSQRVAAGAACAWGLELLMADEVTVERLDQGLMICTREVVR